MNKDTNTTKDQSVKDARVTMGILAAFFIACTGLFMRDQEIQRENYTPGKSVSRKERVAVEAMNDSTLNANLKTYKSLVHDHRVAYAHATREYPGAGRMKYEMHHWLRPNDKVKTVKDFYKYLKQYEASKIEARYKELAKQK